MADNYEILQPGDMDGFRQRQSQRTQLRERRVASAIALWADILDGSVPMWYLNEAIQPRTPEALMILGRNYPGILNEAMTSSDFPLLTGDVLDRMALANYRDFPSTWRNYVKVNTNLRDFRTVRRIATDGLEGTWNSVPEEQEIEYGAPSETGYTYAPLKYAKGAHLSFELIMNDDLSQMQTIPQRLGRGGARTVAKFVTGLYVDSGGPHASLYTGGNANIVTSDPAFSITALQTAMKVLAAQTDAGGDPIFIEAVELVVPPALEITALNVLNALEINMTNAGGASGQELRAQNWMRSRVRLSVDPYIPIVATSNGSTSWFLFANPNSDRPALEVGFLTGFSEPQLYQKMANTVRVGGGLDQAAGDFSTMSQEYKGVIAFGGTRLDPKMTVASNGSG